MNKFKDYVIRKKDKIVTYMLLGGSMLTTTSLTTHAQLGDYIEPAANSVQSEALSILNVGGVLGIVAGALMIVFGKRKECGIVALSTIGGYLIIKYGAEIWALLTGSV